MWTNYEASRYIAVMTPAPIREEWFRRLLSTEPADRAIAEAAVRDLYAATGFAPPQHCCWFESPLAASWAVALLIEAQHPVIGQLLKTARRTSGEREHLASAESALLRGFGLQDLSVLRDSAGPSVGVRLQFMPVAGKFLWTGMLSARMSVYGDVSKMFGVQPGSEQMQRAEAALWSSTNSPLASPLYCPTTGSLVGLSCFADYPLTTMAADESALEGRPAPPALNAAWTIARHAGPWWAFANAVVLCERPAEIHTNEQQLLHRADGPAIAYRDGWEVFAWEGKAIPAQWILHPETVPRGDMKRLGPAFRAQVASRAVAPSAAIRKKPKASVILGRTLSNVATERLQQFREHAGGRLPLFDRYVAGEHARVWSELIALGGAVREDPHAADALAVAYETMGRVDANVRTIIDRLRARGYRFQTPDSSPPHVPPGRRSWQAIQKLEKRAGALPLSLRAFYDVVGAVDLSGVHSSLAPAEGSIAPDQLVVYGVDDALAAVDGSEDEEGIRIPVAPDDLHKCGTSGGDPYEIAAGDLRADGEMLNERHRLFFVDYLRLACRFGGFPGYEGIESDRPSEIEELSAGLLTF